MSGAMENKNKNGGVLKSNAVEGFLGRLSAKKCRDFDLHVPSVETSPGPAPVNVMPPNSEVPAKNCPTVVGGFVIFPPHVPIQAPIGLSSPSQEAHATKDIDQVHDSNNNNNNGEMPVLNCDDADSKVDGAGLVWKKGTKRKFDWKSCCEEMRASVSSAVNVIDLTNPLSIENAKALLAFGVEVPDLVSFTVVNHDGGEDGAAPRIFSFEGGAVDDESAPKRRKLNDLLIEYTWPPKPSHKPRLVIQILSDVDILDDGYSWRKYGQQLIKRSNGSPRSYYKCTTASCPVKKHVERAPYDSRYVITTYDYEDKHNHEVPLLRIRRNRSRGCGDGGDNDATPPPLQ